MANTLKIKRGAAATIPQGDLAEPLFTTDTYDLYIGKGGALGNQRFQKYIASGTSTQFLKGDGSLDSTSYQTALTFSSPLVNTSGTISIPAATGSVNGYLTSTDWTTFNSKEPAITAGTTLQYYRGDKTFQTLDTSVVPENGPVYFTEPKVRATVLTGLNLTGGGTIAATDSVLTAFGKVQNQISALVGGATYQGTWNASTNSPTLASGTGTKGYYYVVSVAGSTNLDGITDWKIGDWAIFNGTTWDKVDNTDAVSSVNGFTGAVNLALDNISDVSAASPTNAQLLRFNGTSSLWENWTPTFEPALTKGNLTEATSSVLTITGGTGAVIGSGTTIAVASAGAAQNGVVTTGTQTFAGAKTFSSDVTINSLTVGRGAGNDSSNTVLGNSALGGSTTSVAGNTAIGTGSLGSNTSGFGNTALGYGSLDKNTTGQSNTAIGVTAGQLIIGSYNTFVGRQAFSQATSGSNNTIIGYAAGIDITSGSNNTLIGGYTGPASALSGNVIISDGSGNIRFLHNGTNGKLPFLTSNGFVKTSGGDGTITIDTTSYLPLTGGTLTGALSGTSATFSSLTNTYILKAGASGLISNSNLINDASGNLGLGVTPSAWGSGYTGFQMGSLSGLSMFAYTGGNEIGQNFYYDTSYKYATTGFASALVQSGGVFYFRNTTSGSANANLSWTNAMILSASGNLSIGNTNDTYKLDVSGTGRFSGDLQVGSGGASSSRFQLRFNNWNTTNSYPYITLITPTGSLYSGIGINTSNDFVIGRTNGLNTDFTQQDLKISNSTGAATFSSSISATSATFSSTVTTNNGIIGNNSNNLYLSSNSAAGEISFWANQLNTRLMTITGGGNVGIGTNSPSAKLMVSGTGDLSYIYNSGASTTDANFYVYSATKDHFIIRNSGNVGIGTSSPSTPLDIVHASGNGLKSTSNDATTANNAGFYFSNTASATAATRKSVMVMDPNGGNATGIDYFYITSLGNGITSLYNAKSDGVLTFGTNDTERMRITSGGQISYSAFSPTVTSATITGTSTQTPTLNTSDTYIYIGSSASAYTLTVANPTGTPTQGQKMIIRFKDNGTQVMGISFGTQFRASSDLALPTTTTAGKTLYCGFIYNSTDTKWDMIALLNNF